MGFRYYMAEVIKINETTANGLFRVSQTDNVATALSDLETGEYELRNSNNNRTAVVTEKIHSGHKVALETIKPGQPIIKYGAIIGVAVKDISEGSWVHLHNMKSMYDARHLDVNTGVPLDINYD